MNKGFEKERIREILNEKVHTINKKDLVPSAILLPIINSKDNIQVLFTKRSKSVQDHKEEISFPGGVKNEDETIKNTVYRELEEELGISSESIEILGSLDEVITNTGYIITPFIGVISQKCGFKINKNEVTELISIPIPKLWRQKYRFEKNERFINKSYQYENHRIWGATARILNEFLEVFKLVY